MCINHEHKLIRDEFLLNHLAHERGLPKENHNSIELLTVFFLKESINFSFRTFVFWVLKK